MDAKHINSSKRLLYLYGGSLIPVLDGFDPQQDQARGKEIPLFFRLDFDFDILIDECPCGCGLKGDICEARLEQIRRDNEELPF